MPCPGKRSDRSVPNPKLTSFAAAVLANFGYETTYKFMMSVWLRVQKWKEFAAEMERPSEPPH
jgi:hypothetical protein